MTTVIRRSVSCGSGRACCASLMLRTSPLSSSRSGVEMIRVRDGEIVRYQDYMDPVALARLPGRAGELAAALAAS